MAWSEKERWMQAWPYLDEALELQAPELDRTPSQRKRGMFVSLAGNGRTGQPHVVTWNLIAQQNHGPFIPCGASIVLANKLAGGTFPSRLFTLSVRRSYSELAWEPPFSSVLWIRPATLRQFASCPREWFWPTGYL